MAMPVIGTHLVPARIRLALAVMTSFLVQPFLPALPEADLNLQTLGMVLQQMLIGIAMAFVLQIVFQVFVIAGQIIAMQMGLGFASMNDPSTSSSASVLGQFYVMLVILLFLGAGGHLLAIHALIDSFHTLPVQNTMIFDRQAFWHLAGMVSWMLGSALLVSLPAVTALLIVNIAFGVMARAAPQLNIFSLGFPMTLLFGLLVVWITLSDIQTPFQAIMNQGFNQLALLVQAH